MNIPEPSFSLKEPNSQNETLLNMKLYIDYKRIVISTGVKVLPSCWNNKEGKPITDKKVLQKLEKEHPGITSKVSTIKTTIANYSTAFEKSVALLNLRGEDFDEKTLKSQIQKELGKESKVAKKITLNEFIETLIKEIEEGKRLTPDGKPFAYSTLKNYKGFKEQFSEFQKVLHRRVDFDDVDLILRDKLVNFFIKKDYSPNTIHRHVKQLKAIMNVAFEKGLHKNVEYQKRNFQTPQIDTTEIYLTENELDEIAKVDLSDNPAWDLARDVFLVGCYTAQRYSDYGRISKEHITTTDNGRKIITLTQVKTGTKVIIPVNTKLDKILAKYDYILPKTYEQKVNAYIKKVVEKAKIDKLEYDDLFTKGKRSTVQKEKHKLVKTHTARRSGATNMFLAGIPVLSIMRITGHKTEREFLKYIRITNQENASNLLDLPYFS